jgi:hypothetical protein
MTKPQIIHALGCKEAIDPKQAHADAANDAIDRILARLDWHPLRLRSIPIAETARLFAAETGKPVRDLNLVSWFLASYLGWKGITD